MRGSISMTPRKMILLATVLIALGLVVLCLAIMLSPREPSFQGRSLSEWLAEFNRISPEKPASEAERAIQNIGSRAVPYLLANIWSNEPLQTSRARKWINSNFHKSYRSRIDLCAPSWRALSILGSAAAPALPDISHHARHGPFRGRAMISLAALGTNSIPVLISLCAYTNADVRVDAAFVLAKSKANMRGLRIFMATSPFSDQPMLAYNIDRGVQDLDLLLSNLKHEQLAVRRATLEAIASDAKMRKLAEPQIRELMQDGDPHLREAAKAVLQEKIPR